MNKKIISGLVGIIVGGAWLANNYKHFEEQGFVAVGMPAIISILGIVYLFQGIKNNKQAGN